MHRRAGFTLFELMFVMIVVGVLAGLAQPHIDLGTNAIRSATQTVGSTLLLAQRIAVTEQHNVVVAFDVDGGLIRVHEDADNDGEIDDGERVRNTEIGDGAAFGRGAAPSHPRVGAGTLSFTATQAGRPALTFHRDGSANEEGGFYLTTVRAARTGASQYADDTRAMVVERATGRASWYRFENGAWERAF